LSRLNKAYPPEKFVKTLKDAGVTGKELRKRTKEGEIDKLAMPEDLKKLWKAYYGYEKEGPRRQRESVNAKVSLKNLPGTKNIRYQRYIIDKKHSNSHAYRHRIETAFRQIRRDILAMIDKQFGDWKIDMSAEKFNRMEGTEKRNWMNKLPPQKRRFVEHELLAVVQQFIADKIDAINEWPTVGLQTVDDSSLTTDGQTLDIEIEVEPYSVNLIILTPVGQ
jgi:hypothetical protein